MSRRRRSDADLPKAPLELAHPMTVPGCAVGGAEVASDVAGPYATMLFRVYRIVLAWTSGAPSAADPDALRRLEQRLLERMDHDEPAAPLAVLLAVVQAPGPEADRSRAAWACMCLAEWALDQNARRTAIAFTQLAALIAPRNARYAWLAARLVFDEGRYRDSEPWYRRAHRVAIWTDDWESQARSLNSLGLASYERGKFPMAKRYYGQAMKVAHRRGLPQMEAMATHNLFVVHSEAREIEEAERYAARTFELYGPKHPRLLKLVADIAIFWNEQGFYTRSLPVLQGLERRFTEPEDRLRIMCRIARAAGSIGHRERFQTAWEEVGSLVEMGVGATLAADALYESGVGAANLGEIGMATWALTRALEIASAHGATEILTNADLALTRIARGEELEPAAHSTENTDSRQPADAFARTLVHSLRS